MEENNNESQKKLIDLLKELAAIQADNMKLSFAIKARETRDIIDDKIQSVKDTINERAKAYGARARKLAEDYVAGENGAELIQNLEETMIELKNRYTEMLLGISDEIANLETEEYELTLQIYELKEEIARKKMMIGVLTAENSKLIQKRENIMKEFQEAKLTHDNEKLSRVSEEFRHTIGPYKKYREQKAQLQQEISINEEMVENMEKILEQIRRGIDNKENDYNAKKIEWYLSKRNLQEQIDNAQSMIPQQNKFQKFVGSILMKINGTKKFSRDVIDKVKEETLRITTEEIPRIANETKDIATKPIKQIISKARDTKYAIIDKVQKRLDAKKQRHIELSQTRIEQIGQEEIKEEEEMSI